MFHMHNLHHNFFPWSLTLAKIFYYFYLLNGICSCLHCRRGKNKIWRYLVFIAMSPFDLVRKGEDLHHCVGKMGYDQKMIRGESLIFFIRAKDAPDKPLVTVEYSPKMKRVLQCYADHNARPNEQIMNFVEKQWLPFANKQIKKLAA